MTVQPECLETSLTALGRALATSTVITFDYETSGSIRTWALTSGGLARYSARKVTDEQEISEQITYETADTNGVIVRDVQDEGPAYLAGVRAGDIIRQVDGDVVKDNTDLISKIASHQPGLQDYFLGSTAAKVVRHATCSVLVMR